MVRKIGLTGGIASGKSKVAEILANMLDCSRIDADEICGLLLEPRAEGWQEFTGMLGSEYLAPDGTINRQLLRQDLFADNGLRMRVNSIIHPLVQKTIIKQMEDIAASDPGARVVVEVPLLYEVQWESLFDTVVVVYADYETCLRRLMVRDGKTRDAAVKELESQLPLTEKVKRADHVIDNSGMLAATILQVEQLVHLFKNGG